jgi:hypothetical protein
MQPSPSWSRLWLRPWTLLLACLCLPIACSEDASDPSGDLPVTIAAHLTSSAGGIAEAFDRTQQIAVQVLVGADEVFAETLDFSPDESVPVRVRLDASHAGSTISVRVTLLANGAALFRGEGSGTLADTGPTTVDLTLSPVIAEIAFDNPVATFTAIGESRRLSGAAVFATGDTVPGVSISWNTQDPEILAVQPNGDAVAQAEGEARIQATGAGVTSNGRALVNPEVAVVTVTPNPATVPIGGTQAFEADLRDRNGNRLQRTPAWTSTNEAAATINASGVATGVGSGVTTITATADGASGSSELTVLAVPLTPANLSASILSDAARTMRLTWEDRAENETHFSIERRAGTGDWFEIGRASPDATSFEGSGVPGENAFRVLACNRQGCSPPSNEVTLTFQSGPPVVTTLESTDVGVIRGLVEGGGTYQVRFQYGYSTTNLTDSAPMPGSGATEFQLPMSNWDIQSPIIYRIVANNQFGESVGEFQEMAAPDVSTSTTSETWTWSQSITFRADLVLPPGVANPVASVEFRASIDEDCFPAYVRNLLDTSATTTNVAGGVRHRFAQDFRAPSSFNCYGTLEVDVYVQFESGASGVARNLSILQSFESSL